MANVLSKSTNFDAHLVSDLISKVRGHSSIANIVPATPVAFNGNKYFTFNYDNEVSLLAENEAKVNGGGTIAPVTINPVKVEYGMRVSDEFMYASEEEQLAYLQAFNDGFAKKMASGLDLMAMHGINPRSNTVASSISGESFDTKVTQTVTYAAATADEKLEDAIALVEGHDYAVTGAILSPAYRTAMAKIKANGAKAYPEFAFGGAPAQLGGAKLDVNPTVSKAVKANSSASATKVDEGIVGDFSMFKWGYGKDVQFKVIEYGNPDNDSTAGDLQGHNQVYLRAEAYIGWAIFDANAFARLV